MTTPEIQMVVTEQQPNGWWRLGSINGLWPQRVMLPEFMVPDGLPGDYVSIQRVSGMAGFWRVLDVMR